MNSLFVESHNSEEEAINCLREISNQMQTRPSYDWQVNKEVKKKRKQTVRHKHGTSCDQTNLKISKLPFIPSKHNMSQNNPCFVQSNNRINSYVLFQKGLGSYGTVNFKKCKGTMKCYNERSKFIKMYSESSQQQIQLIKQWLTMKKENCKSYNQIFFKKKMKENKDQNFLKISVKNIL